MTGALNTSIPALELELTHEQLSTWARQQASTRDDFRAKLFWSNRRGHQQTALRLSMLSVLIFLILADPVKCLSACSLYFVTVKSMIQPWQRLDSHYGCFFRWLNTSHMIPVATGGRLEWCFTTCSHLWFVTEVVIIKSILSYYTFKKLEGRTSTLLG